MAHQEPFITTNVLLNRNLSSLKATALNQVHQRL